MIDILERMIDEANFEGSITNWHMNDFFLEFSSEFRNGAKHKQIRRAFNLQANKLVKLGILEKATKAGIGEGGYSEFGSRTQTIWRYNYNNTVEESKKILRSKR